MSYFNEMEKNLRSIVKQARATVKAYGMSVSSDFDWHLKEIERLPDLIRSLLPAREGDRVVLTKPIKCEGVWKTAEHFLVVGALATVSLLGIDDGKMHAYLTFDDESWIDQKGERRPVEKNGKHVWGIGFDKFAKVEP